jgi:two-component system sensor histidine kinase UhpB
MVVPDIQAVPDVPNVEFSSQLDVRTVVTVAMVRDGELIGVLAVGVNGHVREFAEDELSLLKAVCDQAAQAIANAQLFKAATQQREQLRALSAKVVEAQESERRAVARELHDEIGQLIYAVSANLEAIQISPDALTLAARLADSAALVDEAIQQVRDLALELRPSMLDDFGLVPALTWLVERQAQRSDFTVEFTAEPPELRLAPSLETTIYRIVQIALTNVARHAQAQHVNVTVQLCEAEVELLVRDDGRGFDVAAAFERAIHGATLGLLSLQERARLAGGTLDIQSSPGHGVEIRALFPIDR